VARRGRPPFSGATSMSTTVYAVYFSGPGDYELAKSIEPTARVATSAMHSAVAMRMEVFSWH
ncbi:MAG TPA: hypothetical protein DF699_03105, partial [Phycisphaerales bacterium]|nr:hypothetical protein [Phycisphaerales bacterium]